MNSKSPAFNSMTYGIYERINGMIYFQELLENIETTMRQYKKIVDLLIMVKQQVLNAAVAVYLPYDVGYMNKV